MKNKIFGSLAAFGLSAGVLFGAPQAAASPEAFAGMKPATIKLAHVVNERDSFHLSAVRFKEIVEERSGGKLSVELFPNAVLGDERTLLEGMQMGTVDMGVITNGPVANFVEQMAVFELPFLFPTPEAAYKVLDGEIGQELLGRLERVNLKGLAYAERGFRNLTNSRRAVHGPADVQGMKIRVMENPVYIDTFRALGANAVPMAWTEALTAMQQGTIDGQENPISVIVSAKLSQVQKYLALTGHVYSPAVLVVSPALWGSLNEGQKKAFKDGALAGAKAMRAFVDDVEIKGVDELRGQGMTVVEVTDKAPFQTQLAPAYRQYESKYGKELLGRITETR